MHVHMNTLCDVCVMFTCMTNDDARLPACYVDWGFEVHQPTADSCTLPRGTCTPCTHSASSTQRGHQQPCQNMFRSNNKEWIVRCLCCLCCARSCPSRCLKISESFSQPLEVEILKNTNSSLRCCCCMTWTLLARNFLIFLGNLMVAFQICPNSRWKWLNMQRSKTVFFGVSICKHRLHGHPATKKCSIPWILEWWFCVIPSRPSHLSSVISFANHRLKCCASSFQRWELDSCENWCFRSCREENSLPVLGAIWWKHKWKYEKQDAYLIKSIHTLIPGSKKPDVNMPQILLMAEILHHLGCMKPYK